MKLIIFLAVAVTVVCAAEEQIPMLRYGNQIDPDGTYNWHYQTGNGISADEYSYLGVSGIEATGSFRYTAPDGVVYSVDYAADKEGFRPTRDHLPTPPPTPEAIVRALKLIGFNTLNMRKLFKFYSYIIVIVNE